MNKHKQHIEQGYGEHGNGKLGKRAIIIGGSMAGLLPRVSWRNTLAR